jgi:starch phosphorylase
MKAALNGALNLSIKDGWWDEWYDGENGWAIPSADGPIDADRRDDLEASALYDLIEKNVATRFYDRDARGVPTRWVQMVRHTLAALGPKVLASRMVREYVERLYAPAALASRAMAKDSYAGALDLAHWRERVFTAWPGVDVRYVDSQLSGDATVGAKLTLRAEVALNGLSSEDVTVAAVYGTVDVDDRLVAPASFELHLAAPEDADGVTRYEGQVPLERTGSFGYTVRVLPRHEGLASLAEVGLVATAG